MSMKPSRSPWSETPLRRSAEATDSGTLITTARTVE